MVFPYYFSLLLFILTGQDGMTFLNSNVISLFCNSVSPTTEEILLIKLSACEQVIMVVDSSTTISLPQF
jgi:hypothetical protein